MLRFYSFLKEERNTHWLAGLFTLVITILWRWHFCVVTCRSACVLDVFGGVHMSECTLVVITCKWGVTHILLSRTQGSRNISCYQYRCTDCKYRARRYTADNSKGVCTTALRIARSFRFISSIFVWADNIAWRRPSTLQQNHSSIVEAQPKRSVSLK